MKKISVVILNWNGCDMLRSFLPSVLCHSDRDDVEVCVADNGSTDSSVAMLRDDFPMVRLILLEENHGFAEGYNLALQKVDAEYVVLLNSDVEVTENWLEPLVSYMDAHPEVAACQPKIRSWRQKQMFEYAGAAGGYIDRYGYPFCRGRVMNEVEEDRGQYDTITPVFWATGALCLSAGRIIWMQVDSMPAFCPYGRDRSLLAASLTPEEYCLYPSKCCLSCGGGNAEKREPAEDLSQFS